MLVKFSGLLYLRKLTDLEIIHLVGKQNVQKNHNFQPPELFLK